MQIAAVKWASQASFWELINFWLFERKQQRTDQNALCGETLTETISETDHGHLNILINVLRVNNRFHRQ
jgi:hypothetical protein